MSDLISNCTLTVTEILGVATAVAGRWELGEVIQSVSGDVATFLTHDHFDAAILLEDKKSLSTYETGLETQWGGTTRLVEASPIRAIFNNAAEYIVSEDAQTDPQFQHPGMYTAPIFEANLRARLHVAMVISGEVIGALSFSRNTATPYTKNDIANCLVVSRIISPYVHGLLQSDRTDDAKLDAARQAALREGLRRGARELTGELEKSQAQMGMNLHDQTLADLSRISRTIDDRTELNAEELNVLRSDVSSCLTELRRIVNELRPSVLELFGLAEALRQLVEKENALRPDIEVTFVDQLPDNDAHHDEDVEFGFFRIAQEAIHNAFKHSNASHIDVELTFHDDTMVVSVRDNGCGIEEIHSKNRGGIFNMKTRAALFGAQFEIRPVSPSGTLIYLASPLKISADEKVSA
ncbi:Histidine kinase-, DNA gyrase B-, and HSP90-like ATPase [Aliiroseovarius halocynthiae]|nr:ATP-binding protein [Aliiroseovarius halocynthiae]SMR83610.1 Histidine kinase-, DNA gyrase B-, and HSP90-like ATPase [Aliiroseovarius halocynthiae]